MSVYLVGICYHEPEPFALWQSGVVEDFESITGLWIVAESPEAAIQWGEQVGEALHRYINGDPIADWRADYSCWIDETPASSNWAHCLDFFQRVQVGVMPHLERMGSEAYQRWEQQKL